MKVHIGSLVAALIGVLIALAGVALMMLIFYAGYPQGFALIGLFVMLFGGKLAYDLAGEAFIRTPSSAPRDDDEAYEDADEERDEWWDARREALASVLGKPDRLEGHAIIPLFLDGQADTLTFRSHVEGVVYTTCDLIGDDRQKRTALGNYELMICHRADNEWGHGIVSSLARYTQDAYVEPWDTMELQHAAPEGSVIVAFLFVPYTRFKVLGQDCGILLCLGITSDELEVCRSGKKAKAKLFERLRDCGVFPYTDLERESVLR